MLGRHSQFRTEILLWIDGEEPFKAYLAGRPRNSA
jgi:hypothetical protein